MYTGMFALALGLMALRLCRYLPPVGWLLVLPVVGADATAVSYLSAGGFWLLGLAWACVQGQRALDDRLSDALDGRTLWLEGRVSGLPQHGVLVGFDFELSAAGHARTELPARIA
jgi:competence protein ComEC